MNLLSTIDTAWDYAAAHVASVASRYPKTLAGAVSIGLAGFAATAFGVAPMVPDAFDESRWDYYYFFSSRNYKEPLKRRLTVYFADEKVQRIENLGVPTQADLAQLEADLQRAIEETRKNRRKPSLWQRMTGRGGANESGTTDPASEAAKEPDPLPPSQPLPVPAGTPSGPT